MVVGLQILAVYAYTFKWEELLFKQYPMRCQSHRSPALLTPELEAIISVKHDLTLILTDHNYACVSYHTGIGPTLVHCDVKGLQCPVYGILSYGIIWLQIYPKSFLHPIFILAISFFYVTPQPFSSHHTCIQVLNFIDGSGWTCIHHFYIFYQSISSIL